MNQIIATDNNVNFASAEPAIDPNNRPVFLMDWEVTLKCNLDCSYCGEGPNGYHWNASKHPEFSECMKSLDFLLEYADIYMNHKKPWTKHAVLNVYGGESLHHPNIVEILKAVREKHKKYADDWSLRITCTTNAVIAKEKFINIANYVDEFTMSYHSESNIKSRETFKRNLFWLHHSKKSYKCIIMMHYKEPYWTQCVDFVKTCQDNNINFLAKQLDAEETVIYSDSQTEWLSNYYKNNTVSKSQQLQEKQIQSKAHQQISTSGRSCCGGRKMCLDQNFKKPITWIDNNFRNWYCSVNWFFVYVKQYSKEIYVNKDCRMNFENKVAPIGHIDQAQVLLDYTRDNLEKNSLPTIQCAKPICFCGMCAPKAKSLEDYNDLFTKYKVD